MALRLPRIFPQFSQQLPDHNPVLHHRRRKLRMLISGIIVGISVSIGVGVSFVKQVCDVVTVVEAFDLVVLERARGG
jgi:hypothetical protein